MIHSLALLLAAYTADWPSIIAREVPPRTAACPRSTQYALYALQVKDILVTNSAYRDGVVEGNGNVRIFQGRNHRNIIGNVIGAVVWDAIGGALTRRSPALRCAYTTWEGIQTVNAINRTEQAVKTLDELKAKGWTVHNESISPPKP